jgi:hypothetical protein
MKKVYRIEEPESGLGPYACGAIWEHYASHRPMPYEDGIQTSQRGMVYGFISKRQLTSWFRMKCRRSLEAQGFLVSTYAVPTTAIIRGGTQVAFVKVAATLIAVAKPTEF